MDIQEIIDKLLTNSEEIRKAYPTVSNVRHDVMDIPYTDLKHFAQHHKKTIHTSPQLKRAYVIYNPVIDGKIDTDIWLYSVPVNIQPQQITEL